MTNVTDEQYGEFHRRLDEIARRIKDGSILFDTIMPALQVVIEGGLFVKSHRVTVERFTSIEDGCLRCGFDVIGESINTVNFPLKESTRDSDCWQMKVVTFVGQVYNNDVRREFENRNWRSATLRELMAFCHQFPMYMQKAMIMALGETFRKDKDSSHRLYAPGAHMIDEKRCLDLGWSPVGHDIGTQYLAVEKFPVAA